MSVKSRFVIFGASVLLACLIWMDARAGNLQSPAPPAYQIYNLELALGQGFTFVTNPSDPGDFQRLVVDDITYTVDLNPCFTEPRCLTFGTYSTGPFWRPTPFIPDGTPDPVGLDYEWYYNDQSPVFVEWMIRWSEARGTYWRADMVDTNSAGVAAAHGRFDSISHSLYGQTLGRVYLYDEGNGECHCPRTRYSETLTTSVTTSQTSESRHYQTPYVVQSGYVRFRGVTGAGFSNYLNARAYVKGRVFFSYQGSMTPSRNTNFDIVTE